jgi:hypothetical protein
MTIRRMRIACWIPNATITHSECVKLTAFPLQHQLQEHASMLCYTYFANLIISVMFLHFNASLPVTTLSSSTYVMPVSPCRFYTRLLTALQLVWRLHPLDIFLTQTLSLSLAGLKPLPSPIHSINPVPSTDLYKVCLSRICISVRSNIANNSSNQNPYILSVILLH